MVGDGDEHDPTPRFCPRAKGPWVSRLATRVAVRVLAGFLLLFGVAGGLYLSGDPKTQRGMDNASEAGFGFLYASSQQRAAEQEARTKAAAEAKTAAAKARSAEEAARRNEPASRSQPRTDVGPIPASCAGYKDNRAIGCKLLLEWGFGLDQMPCLDKLWTRESRWTTTASNSSSGAYGIPQALPGSKMSKYGADWKTNPATQIKWGLDYVKGRYSTPCGAWSFFESHGWY
jgi:hypothetical protein